MHGNFTNEERRVVSFFIWDPELERKIDREVKMIDGIGKMLKVATNSEQIIECNKALLLSQQRMLEFMSEIRRKQENLMRKDRTTLEPCKGTVYLSDIRVQLNWNRMKKAKSEQKRFAVFCLARIGCEIIDTQLKFVDKQSSEILFTDQLTFENVPFDFELTLEFYALNTSLSLSSSARDFAERYSYFSNHGTPRSSRKSKQNPTNEKKSNDEVQSKFVLIGRAKLNKSQTDRLSKVRPLTLEQNQENPLMKLPLESCFISRFDCQASSFSGGSVFSGILLKKNLPFSCEISSGFLRGEEISVRPTVSSRTFSIPINEETIILSKNDSTSLTIFNRSSNQEEFFAQDSFELTRWIRALQQQIVDTRAWKSTDEPKFRERRFSQQILSENLRSKSPTLKAKTRSLDDLSRGESVSERFEFQQTLTFTEKHIEQETYRTRF